MRRFHFPLLLPVLLTSLLIFGCAGMDAASVLGSLGKVGKAVSKTFEDITPEQEYYIGRAVAATVMSTYKPLNSKRGTHYINAVGLSLSRVSDLPETFGGYHFQILDTDEINAFAAPGGLIMISKGLIKCCRTEDELAAVLAHEIAHVQLKHGLRAIKKARLTSALTILGVESAKAFGGQELAELTTAFEDSITDITSTLINSGYSRAYELEADAATVVILRRIGYGDRAVVTMLQEMHKRLKPESAGFGKTHPSPEDRIKELENEYTFAEPTAPCKTRNTRFKKALSSL